MSLSGQRVNLTAGSQTGKLSGPTCAHTSLHPSIHPSHHIQTSITSSSRCINQGGRVLQRTARPHLATRGT
ncbi:hypothetical protein CPAR01_02441 [Colletotrichum paranaense]|uniref:Uncharacterized protein n=1 Tax=Colletotrichum paranaense TaxID=1914294 RepID=A0ABQ9SZJ5_9PEZI|nr:uncharacterized protein CPAR01_02441 [Colletotrichum paranaense]KAK1544939.1 hypothetical protein CPAR01_02441 [Colletotrichum paranaense]